MHRIDVFPTNAVFAAAAWLGFGTVLATIKWGRGWRERVDGPGQVHGEHA